MPRNEFIRQAKFLLGLLAIACGGAVAKDHTQAAAAGGSAASMQEPTMTELLDDVDHAGSGYPQVPAGSSGFFWRGGLANWFVTPAEGRQSDAKADETGTSTGQEAGKAYHVSGDGQSLGVDLWVELDHPSRRPVDLSAYSGISFRARLIGAASSLAVAFSANGQYFARGAFAPAVTTSGEWQTITLPFANVVDLDSSAISSIDFIVTSGGAPFDLWVDDLALRCRGKCP